MPAQHTAPPSPAASPTTSPLLLSDLGIDLKVSDYTQDSTQRDHEATCPYDIDALAKEYNRRSIPIMDDRDFIGLVRDLARTPESADLETKLLDRMNAVYSESSKDLEHTKRVVFLNDDVADDRMFSLLPLLQRPTHKGYSLYIQRTLLELNELRRDQHLRTQAANDACLSPSSSSIVHGPGLPHILAKPHRRLHKELRGRGGKGVDKTASMPRRSARIARIRELCSSRPR